MDDKKILIVEDNEEQKIYSGELVRNFDVKLYHLSTFRECQEIIPNLKLDGILSDLYFPSGYEINSEIHQEHKERTLNILRSYIEGVKTSLMNPLLNATELTLGREVDDSNLEEIVSNVKNIGFLAGEDYSKISESLRRGVDDKSKLKEYENLIAKISDDVHLLPEGLFVYELAKEQEIPCVIVTSCYHHGSEFQPFVSEVGRYVDAINPDGSKQWKKGYELLRGSLIGN
jgi:hypothetical protein